LDIGVFSGAVTAAGLADEAAAIGAFGDGAAATDAVDALGSIWELEGATCADPVKGLATSASVRQSVRS
jgi:hypothetical protein